VRAVLETFVRFGVPRRILYDGKPHLGTDALVRLLKRFREELLGLGAIVRFDSRVDELVLEAGGSAGGVAAAAAEACVRGRGGRVRGVRLATGETILADATLLAAGHSARELYERLVLLGAAVMPKDFAVGFRIEHPQVGAANCC
jgi:uncharacterized FAD-dependent dehydrogenase